MASTVVTRARRGPIAATDPGMRIALRTVDADQAAVLPVSTSEGRVRYGGQMAIDHGCSTNDHPSGATASMAGLDEAGSTHRATKPRAAYRLPDTRAVA